MAGRIRDEDIQTVRDSVPIDTVVADQLQLRNAGGGNLKGLCPFHDEKSPSFQVSPDKGLYYCFGCGEGGDTLDFVMKLEHLSFSEAVERLAGQAGIALRYEEGGYTPGRQQGERARLVEANKAAAEYFSAQLHSDEALPARQFLAERGFDATTAEHFHLGYAPAGWEHLVRHLRGRGFTDRELLNAGLASEGRRGPRDRFRGRLIWPIRDITSEIVGFGARQLRDDDQGPKYLNTPETPLYHKSHVLYGIEQAKRDIAKSGRAVLVEGYTDVMACHLAGVTTAIATCGTSFGEEHIKILRRLLMDTGEFRGEVVFTFDGDAAGQRAAMRAFELDQKFVTSTFVAVEPSGADPCDLRLAKGDAAVRDLVDSRVPLFEFAIRTVVNRYDLDSAEGRVAALNAAAPIIARIRDNALRDVYAVELDHWLGMLDEQKIRRRVSDEVRRLHSGNTSQQLRQGRGPEHGTRETPLAQTPDGNGQQRPHPSHPTAGTPAGTSTAGTGQRSAPRPDPRDPTQAVERETLKLALQHPDLVAPTLDAFEDDEFTATPYALLRRTLAQAGGVRDAGRDWVTRVRELAPDDQLRSLITELAVEPLHTRREPDEKYAGDQLVSLRQQAVARRIRQARAHFQRLGTRGDPEQLATVQRELWLLQQYEQQLRSHGAAAL